MGSEKAPDSQLVTFYLVGPDCFTNNTVLCGQCYRTTVSQSEAASPVFIKENRKHYDWGSGRWPTWTESVWKGFSARSFLLGSPGGDQIQLASPSSLST